MEHQKWLKDILFCIYLREYEIIKLFQCCMDDSAFFKMGKMSCFLHLFHILFWFLTLKPGFETKISLVSVNLNKMCSLLGTWVVQYVWWRWKTFERAEKVRQVRGLLVPAFNNICFLLCTWVACKVSLPRRTPTRQRRCGR